MSDFENRYNEACKELRAECDRMVEDGELTEEMANFRYYMVRDEILEAMPE
jgi:hypothetical protein